MLLCRLALTTTLMTASSFAFAGDDDRDALAAAVRASIEAHQDLSQTGVAVAVLRDGRFYWAEGFGERDRAQHLPVTTETLFAVASTTKAFTATLLAEQEQAGLVALDQPINGQIPGLAIRLDKPEVTAQITAEDMLSHRAGLPRHDLLWIGAPYDAATMLPRLQFLGMNEAPGQGFREAFQYNNNMFMAASQITAALTGQTWESVATERLLRPLGMRGATFDFAAAMAREDRAVGYLGEEIQPNIDFAPVAAAGGLNASARDMARWVEMHLQRGVGPKGERLVSEAALDSTYRNRQNAGDGWGYGLGWFLGTVEGERVIEHGGNSTIATSVVMFQPETGFGVVVLTNQAWSSLPSSVAADVLKHLNTSAGDLEAHDRDDAAYLDVPLAIERAAMRGDRSTARELESDQALMHCVGRFVDRAYGPIEIVAEPVKGGGEELYLQHHLGRFLLKADERPGVPGTPPSDDPNGNPLPPPPAPLPSTLATFALSWTLGGMAATIPGTFSFDKAGTCIAVEMQLESSARPSRFDAEVAKTTP